MKRNCVICREPILADSAFCAYCGAKQPDRAAAADDAPTMAVSQPPTPLSPFSSDAKPFNPESSATNDPPAQSSPSPYAPPPAASPYAPPTQPSVQSPSPYAPPASYDAPYAPQTPPSYNQPAAQQPPSYPPSYGQQGYNQPAQNPYPQPPYNQPQNPNYPPYQAGYSGGQPPYGAPNYAQTAPQPQAKSNVGKWLIGLGLLLVMVAIGYAVFQATRGSSTSSNASPTAQVAAVQATRTPRPTRTPQPEDPTPTADSAVPTDLPVPEVQALNDASGRLVYLSSSSFELVSAPASGGDETKLALNDSAFYSSSTELFARDGSKLAYHDQKGNGAVIKVANGDGSDLRDVATLTNTVPYELKWSPDASKLAFVASDADTSDNSEQNVFVLDVASGELRQVSNGGNVDTSPLAWSTDSQRLVFSQESDEKLQLHAVNADGSNDQSLLETYTYGAWWLPDGRIVYEDFCDQASFTRGICAISPDSKNVEQLAELGDNSINGISPDNKWLTLDNYADGSLSLFNLETAAFEEVVPPEQGENVRFRSWSVWSPDMQYVTYRDLDTYATYAYKIGSKQPPVAFTLESVLAWLP